MTYYAKRVELRIDGKQVDAAGGFDQVYVIIDCVTTVEKEDFNSIREKIEKWRGNYNIFKEGMKNRENLKKYDDIRLVIAIRNFKTKEKDVFLATRNPRVHLWDSQFFDYYTSLYDKIGNYAIYELKRELEVPIKEQVNNVPTLKISGNNGIDFYMGIANPLEILKISFVARRERGDQQYYQRMILKEKLEKLAYYIHKQKKEFYNNVIIAANGRDNLQFNIIEKISNRYEYGLLNINGLETSLKIIDGQHRLYGFAQAIKRFTKVTEEGIPNWVIPFSIVSGIDEVKQGQLFMDINTNQTSLNADYIWDLRSMYGTDNQKFISNIVKELNQLGCVKDMVYIPSYSVTRMKGGASISKIARGLEENKKIFNSQLDSGVRNPLVTKGGNSSDPVNIARFLESMLNLVKNKNEKYFKFYLNGAGIQVFIQLLSDFYT